MSGQETAGRVLAPDSAKLVVAEFRSSSLVYWRQIAIISFSIWSLSYLLYRLMDVPNELWTATFPVAVVVAYAAITARQSMSPRWRMSEKSLYVDETHVVPLASIAKTHAFLSGLSVSTVTGETFAIKFLRDAAGASDLILREKNKA